jgi:hypothetical protein
MWNFPSLRRIGASTVGVLALSLLLGTIFALPGWFHLLDPGHRNVAVEEMRPADFAWATSRRVVVRARANIESAYESHVRTGGGRDRWLCVPLLPLDDSAGFDRHLVWALIPIEGDFSEVSTGLKRQQSFEGVLRNVLWEQRESEGRLTGPDQPVGHPNALVVQVGRNQQADLAAIAGPYLGFVGAGIVVLLLRRRAKASSAS